MRMLRSKKKRKNKLVDCFLAADGLGIGIGIGNKTNNLSPSYPKRDRLPGKVLRGIRFRGRMSR